MKEFFELQHTAEDSKARTGVLHTDHGDIQTPIFMPVGTRATVKAVDQRELKEMEAPIILGNTYHLYLRPGDKLINTFGGLHKFMNWDGAMLTDSGGYQVFSLQDIRKIRPEGVEFKSHIDGSKHFFSPESVVDIQRNLGSDIMMVLDECVPYPSEKKYTADSLELSLKWAKQASDHFGKTENLYGHRQFHFAIGQGGMYEDLRIEYIKRMTDMEFDGFAIGGLSVGEPAELMYELTDISTDYLPKDKPRYLMGVGTPMNILNAIERGIDMFDCVMPTRNARNGQIFTTRGKLNLRNAKHKLSDEQIDPGLDNYTSNHFSLGYLNHLIKTEEILGMQIASRQNLSFYLWLVKTAREKINTGEFRRWKAEMSEIYPD
jgi:queuine tRNA-ribosyltransferase